MLDDATSEAKRRGHDTVTPAHVAVALIALPDTLKPSAEFSEAIESYLAGLEKSFETPVLADDTQAMLTECASSSDPVKACKLVEDACNEHVNVLKDPIPRAFFELMGESSLQITARLFLDDLNLRLPTQHELLVAIHEKFNREKIEVPFPQRDLHIRSIGPDVMSLFEGRVKNGVDVQRGSDSK